MALFPWLSAAGVAVVVIVAALVRGRLYATFAAVLLGIHTLVSVALAPQLAWCWPVYAYLQASVYVHFAFLVRPRLRSLPYRAFVSMPASWFVAATLLAVPWAVAAGLGHPLPAPWIAHALALAGLIQSLRHQPEEIDLTLDDAAVESLRRHPHPPGPRVERPLAIVQITDPHLGPFMSEERLRAICERAVAKDPDLVLLTGDFVTMESHDAHEALARALAPLAALRGRVFACRGNHDHEAPATVERALAAVGARLLIDEAVDVETSAGPVQLVGMDFSWRRRKERMAAVCERHPRRPGRLRIVLLHDPGAFRDLGDGEADLVLSGHTHGGQLGLLSLGLPHTFVSAFSAIPDHGLWALGRARLYVHRGTGHYGFPIRIGVPAEESVLRLHWPGWSAADG